MIIGNLFPFFNGICWSMTKEVNIMKDGRDGSSGTIGSLGHHVILLGLLSISAVSCYSSQQLSCIPISPVSWAVAWLLQRLTMAHEMSHPPVSTHQPSRAGHEISRRFTITRGASRIYGNQPFCPFPISYVLTVGKHTISIASLTS